MKIKKEKDMKNLALVVGGAAGGVPLGDYVIEKSLSLELDKLLELVTDITGTTINQLCSGWRNTSVVQARHMYYNLAHDIIKPRFPTFFTGTKVASKINQDHSSVYHALKQHKGYCQVDKNYSENYKKTFSKFQSCLDPLTTDGFISNRISVHNQIVELQAKLAQLDKELDNRGYFINPENGRPILK